MILSDREIQAAIRDKNILIDPPPDEALFSSTALDLTLDGVLLRLEGAGEGYILARPADRLKVGEIIRFIDGPIAPVDCVSVSRPKECEYPGHCPFFGFWGRVREAIADVVDQTSFADLINENKGFGITYIADWTI